MKMNITEIMNEYKPNLDICSENDDEMLLIKNAIDNLTNSDKIIFIMYCELGSLRKVGKELGVSHTIIYKEITKIKNKIYDYIKNVTVSNNNLLLDRFKRCNNIV